MRFIENVLSSVSYLWGKPAEGVASPVIAVTPVGRNVHGDYVLFNFFFFA